MTYPAPFLNASSRPALEVRAGTSIGQYVRTKKARKAGISVTTSSCWPPNSMNNFATEVMGRET